MKRKTFFKALAGLIVAPTLLAKEAEPKKAGWGNKGDGIKSYNGWDVLDPNHGTAGEKILVGDLLTKKHNRIYSSDSTDKIFGVALNSARKGDIVSIVRQELVTVRCSGI